MKRWPAEKTELRPVEGLAPYAQNARTHSEKQVAQIAASIQEWGWTIPVLVDEDGGIIAGHGRVLAARKLGIAEVPVMVARGWTDAQKRAYVIADNKLALNAGWDIETLALELGDLQGMGVDLDLIGFAPDEVDEMFAPANGGSPDGKSGLGSLAGRFGVAPFSVISAREGWWQDRKRAWVALGIQSELGRGAAISGAPMPLDRNATPGGSPMPAANYSKTKARGDGRGRAVKRG